MAAFLRDLGMPQYAGKLIANGFDDMDTLLCIEDSDLVELGIVSCHLVKLRRRLQELQRREAAEKGRVAGEDNHPVAVFLRESGLGKYVGVFFSSGFDEMETLHDMEDHDMKDLGLPRGHALKLKRRLRELKAAQDGTDAAQEEQELQRQTSDKAQPPASKAPLRAAPSGSTLPDEAGMSAVERSWECLQARGVEDMAQTFYRHIFLLSPEAIALFPPEVRLKYRDWLADERGNESNVYESPALRKLFSKMLNAIGCTVAGLHDFGKLVPMLNQLGSRHVNYGVNETHWTVMREALIYTLRDCLGSAFTQEVETAWTMVYTFMTSIMLEGLRHAAAAKEAAAAFWIEAPLSRGAGLWVEDCLSQGCRKEISHSVTPGHATTVAAQQVMGFSRLKRLPQLWEDDDAHSEDSLSTGIPSVVDSLQRQCSPSVEAVRQTPKCLSFSGQPSPCQGPQEVQPLIAG